MATPKKTSPDYDPINEALDIGYEEGRRSERARRSEFVQRARRGGERRGQAKVTAARQQERSALAKREAQRRAGRAERIEREKASARRGAYRAGVADAKRQAAQLTQPSRPARQQQSRQRTARAVLPASFTQTQPQRLSAPSFNLGLDRSNASRLIVIMMVLTGGATVAQSALAQQKVGPTVMQTKGGNIIKVPSHLRAFGATIIIGTVALVVAEFAPGIGVTMMLVFAVAVFADFFTAHGIADQLSVTILGAQTTTNTRPLQAPPTSGGSSSRLQH